MDIKVDADVEVLRRAVSGRHAHPQPVESGHVDQMLARVVPVPRHADDPDPASSRDDAAIGGVPFDRVARGNVVAAVVDETVVVGTRLGVVVPGDEYPSPA